MQPSERGLEHPPADAEEPDGALRKALDAIHDASLDVDVEPLPVVSFERLDGPRPGPRA
jgi:hypothetical protein